ncbi:MAG TPA: PSD1 and planctomycete cytochrome C domain-containing protein [Gemmataceae bacterium]|nr:PSD1 and planctomycete cytochrome C domain-containing protein [Gemmataceae bacterium]
MKPDENRASRRTRLAAAFGLFLIATLPGPLLAKEPKPIDFAHDIVPLIKAHCAECHTNGKHKGSLSLDTRQAILRAKVVVPGKSGASEMVKRITSQEADERMPPKGKRLTEREVALIRAWIDQGLSWQEGFSFAAGSYVPPLKPRRPSLPPAHEGRDHPIDRIVDAYYSRHKLTPPAPLDDSAFARRVYLDVIGQLPAAEELDAFVKDADPGRRDRLIRRLLDDRRAYAEHWLTFWNDLLRNDYQGTGYIDGGRKQITGWLYRSLLDNKPYDQFVRELISPSPESEGFIKGIKWRGKVNASQVPELQFSQNVSQVFFGINMKCASCHDSFIDTWKLDDAYSLAAVIADKPLEIHRCDKPLGRKAVPRFLWPELGSIDAKQPRARRLEQLARLVTHPDNGRFQRTIANRLWQRLFGRGIVHPVDVMANKPWSEDLLDYLGTYLADHGYDLKRLIELITRSQAYQSRTVVLREEMPAESYVFRGPEGKRMTAEQFLDAIWQITGTAPTKPAAPVKLPPFASTTPAGRRYVRAALVKADALMRSMGRPNREQVVTTRPDQLTTLQALDLSNGRILADTLARGAAQLLKKNPKTTREQWIERLYLQALCRQQTAAELDAGREILGSPITAESLADLLWAVFMLPEFQMIR